jgi:hypothetical protein
MVDTSGDLGVVEPLARDLDVCFVLDRDDPTPGARAHFDPRSEDKEAGGGVTRDPGEAVDVETDDEEDGVDAEDDAVGERRALNLRRKLLDVSAGRGVGGAAEAGNEPSAPPVGAAPPPAPSASPAGAASTPPAAADAGHEPSAPPVGSAPSSPSAPPAGAAPAQPAASGPSEGVGGGDEEGEQLDDDVFGSLLGSGPFMHPSLTSDGQSILELLSSYSDGSRSTHDVGEGPSIAVGARFTASASGIGRLIRAEVSGMGDLSDEASLIGGAGTSEVGGAVRKAVEELGSHAYCCKGFCNHLLEAENPNWASQARAALDVYDTREATERTPGSALHWRAMPAAFVSAARRRFQEHLNAGRCVTSFAQASVGPTHSHIFRALSLSLGTFGIEILTPPPFLRTRPLSSISPSSRCCLRASRAGRTSSQRI